MPVVPKQKIPEWMPDFLRTIFDPDPSDLVSVMPVGAPPVGIAAKFFGKAARKLGEFTSPDALIDPVARYIVEVPGFGHFETLMEAFKKAGKKLPKGKTTGEMLRQENLIRKAHTGLSVSSYQISKIPAKEDWTAILDDVLAEMEKGKAIPGGSAVVTSIEKRGVPVEYPVKGKKFMEMENVTLEELFEKAK